MLVAEPVRVMRKLMLDLMDAMADGIVALEETADEVAHSAYAYGDEADAETVRHRARTHRIKALEMHGRLTGLRADYAELYGEAP